jgi:hypothetical protein
VSTQAKEIKPLPNETPQPKHQHTQTKNKAHRGKNRGQKIPTKWENQSHQVGQNHTTPPKNQTKIRKQKIQTKIRKTFVCTKNEENLKNVLTRKINLCYYLIVGKICPAKLIRKLERRN